MLLRDQVGRYGRKRLELSGVASWAGRSPAHKLSPSPEDEEYEINSHMGEGSGVGG